jgi:pimeloyl-ACP methyl ester carboxylesterase
MDVTSCGRPEILEVDGRPLRVHEWGSGPASVILLHSLAGHSHWWDWAAPLLATRGRVVALDFRGHGGSAWTEPAAYDFDDYVADVRAVLERLAARAPLLIGHSMGGYIAARVAARHPDHVGALVIADMLTGWSAEMDARARAQAERAGPTFASREDAGARFRMAPPETTAPPDRLRHLGEAGVVERQSGVWTYAFDRRVFLHPPPAPWSFFGDVRCPTLVVRAEGSAVMSRDAAERVAKTVARGEAAELGGAYHHLVVDDPEGFVRLVDDWEARR